MAKCRKELWIQCTLSETESAQCFMASLWLRSPTVSGFNMWADTKPSPAILFEGVAGDGEGKYMKKPFTYLIWYLAIGVPEYSAGEKEKEHPSGQAIIDDDREYNFKKILQEKSLRTGALKKNYGAKRATAGQNAPLWLCSQHR